MDVLRLESPAVRGSLEARAAGAHDALSAAPLTLADSVRAIGWLRWRLLVNGIRGGRRRDALERSSRVLALIVPGILGLIMLAVMSGLAIGALYAGWEAARGRTTPAVLTTVLRVASAIILGMMIMMQIAAASQRSRARYDRLLLVPISRRALHLVEVIASVGDPWVALAIPALVALALALLVAPGITAIVAGVAALIAGGCFAAVLATLCTIIESLMSWLMKSRRRAELFTLVFAILMANIGLFPLLLGERDSSGRLRASRVIEGDSAKATDSVAKARQADAARLPDRAWLLAMPSETYARAVGATLARRYGDAGALLAILGAETALLYLISAALHRRMLDSPESGDARRTSKERWLDRVRIPGLNPVSTAIATTTARTALRSVRGRLAVLMPGPFLAGMAIVSRRVPEAVPAGVQLGAYGEAMLGSAVIFLLYSLMGFTMNQFASDRAGLTLQLLVPARDRDIVVGKLIGLGALALTGVALAALATLAVFRSIEPGALLMILIAGIGLYVAMSPVAVLMSATLPVASDLTKTGMGGNPHGGAMLLGTVLYFALAFVPGRIVAQAVKTRDYWHGVASVSIYAAVVIAIAIPLLIASARILGARRENIAMVAQGK